MEVQTPLQQLGGIQDGQGQMEPYGVAHVEKNALLSRTWNLLGELDGTKICEEHIPPMSIGNIHR